MRRAVIAIVIAGCWTGPKPAPPRVPPPRPRTKIIRSELPPRALPDGDVELGRTLYVQLGCVTCHTLDGTPRVGPSWRGIWDSDVVLSDHRLVHVDAEYIRQSLAEPLADLVLGFPPVMPSFRGRLSNDEIDALIALIATLR